MAHYTIGQERDVQAGLRFLERIADSLEKLVEQGQYAPLVHMQPPTVVYNTVQSHPYPDDEQRLQQ